MSILIQRLSKIWTFSKFTMRLTWKPVFRPNIIFVNQVRHTVLIRVTLALFWCWLVSRRLRDISQMNPKGPSEPQSNTLPEFYPQTIETKSLFLPQNKSDCLPIVFRQRFCLRSIMWNTFWGQKMKSKAWIESTRVHLTFIHWFLLTKYWLLHFVTDILLKINAKKMKFGHAAS